MLYAINMLSEGHGKGEIMNGELTTRETGAITTPAGEIVKVWLEGRSEKTVEAYRQDLTDFAEYIGADSTEDGAAELIAAGQGRANVLVLNYRNRLVENDLAAATINRRLAALRSLTKLARTTGRVSWALEVPGVKAEARRDTRGPGRGGIVKMLADLGRGKKAARDKVILRLLFDLGLRRGEVAALDYEDADLEAGEIRIISKGHREKQALTLPDQTAEALKAWIDIRGSAPGALFTNADRAGKGNGRLQADGIYRMIRRRGELAGLKVRPHSIRHTAITTALDLVNGDIRAAAKFSRHRDIRTLSIYDDRRQDLNGEVARKVAAAV